ncbi:MAG: enoyl-CoA hydratase/isomerase family protein [Magnetospirillum sp. WYHS-4]
MTGELVLELRDGVGRAVLDRPQALNALSMAMYRGLAEAFRDWEADPEVRMVVVEGAGERAFCAGGDIRVLWDARASGDLDFMAEIFRLEYRLNRRVHRYAKPYVALMDGIVMGGGCGISVHGSHRVVTERTRLAMPETGIGFFPDIGASWFLPRCPGEIGAYLSLSGAMIGAADALHAGLADAFLPSARLPELVAALRAGAPVDAIGDFAADPGPSWLADHQGAIDRAFAGQSVADILAALDKEGEWGHGVAKTLAGRSPFSLAVALKALRVGAAMASVEECLTMEYRLCRRFLERDELFEGIRAAVVDKDRNPHWERMVDPAAVEACFRPLGLGDLTFE